MAAITLNEEQTKLFRLCLKYAEPLKPNWEKVAEEGDIISTSAASQRWGRLYKILIGDEKVVTPSKAKGKTSNNGGRKAKQKSTPKDADPKTSISPEEEMCEMVDGGTPAQPASQTPKKRQAHSLGSDTDENGTPTKVVKTEFKEEDSFTTG